MNTSDTLTKVSAYPITFRSIDAVNKVSTQYYDHGRAALTEAIFSQVDFCFNPWFKNLRPMIAFYLSHRMSIGMYENYALYDLPTVESVLKEHQSLIEFIKASTLERKEELK